MTPSQRWQLELASQAMRFERMASQRRHATLREQMCVVAAAAMASAIGAVATLILEVAF